ncbi:MAG: polysaccharide biosynthesis protein [Clostridiales Family XIII bacterium]|jgi:stage V sporulation protein B|nr:polysaccharide biosynthesis protein [Clostridiales Family XIII bacterium]
MAKKTFFYGAMVLTGASILSKLLGAIFRIPVTNLIGPEAMAYYQAVYPIYVILLTVSIAGFPVAISRTVSERLTFGDHYGAHRVFKISLVIMALLGTVSMVIMWLIAEPLSQRLGDLSGAVYGMKAIAPALLFVTVIAAFRGYFQGMQNMRPTAAVQVTEQLFRVITGLTFAAIFVGKSLEYGAAGATSGATFGALAGLVLMLIIYAAKVRQPGFREEIAHSRELFRSSEQPLSKVLKALFSITIPIVIGALVMPMMNSLDLAIVANRLTDTGWDPSEVRSMYGQLSAMAGAIINLPQVVTQSIAISLVPTIISAFKTRDHEFLGRNVSISARMTMLISLPCSVGVFVLARPIMLLLYPRYPDDAMAAAPSLMILAVGIVFLTAIQTMTAILQGVERQWRPMVNLLAGAVVKGILTFTLTGIVAVNIRGAAAGTVGAYMVAAFLNYRAIKKYAGITVEWRLVVVRPLISALVMGGCAFGAYKLCMTVASGSLSLLNANAFATLAGVAVGGLVYVIMVFATDAISRDELAMLPKSGGLVRIYDKLSRSRRKGR